MPRNLCITAADGQTGYLVTELLLTNMAFSEKLESITGLSLNPSSPKCKELQKLGAKIVEHKPGRVREMAQTLKQTGADAICIIPPANQSKMDITKELVEASKQASILNVCLISSAGCDLADEKRQSRLREFIEIEQMVMSTKGDSETETGHSPVVIRAGFYAENLLNYTSQAQKESTLPLPIGPSHKFAPIALGDVALCTAHVLSGYGKHGFNDKHRGQLIVLTGPTMAAGNELAEAASQALGQRMKFEDISEDEAKRVLKTQSDSDASELQYLLEYYSLVKEGKTNYISTLAFHDVTGQHPQELTEWFKIYADEFKPKQHLRQNKKRKLNGK